MHTSDIQVRVDQLVKAMLAKGLPQPSADFEVRSNLSPRIVLWWKNGDKSYDRHCELVGGSDPETILDEADKFIAELPSAEENRRNAFLSALGKVIDLGRENGIEVEFINPLVKTMKRLAEAALTDQRVAPAE
jgi:hypothetical protein